MCVIYERRVWHMYMYLCVRTCVGVCVYVHFTCACVSKHVNCMHECCDIRSCVCVCVPLCVSYIYVQCVFVRSRPPVLFLPRAGGCRMGQASLPSCEHLPPQFFSCERVHLEPVTSLVLPEDFLSFSLMMMCLFLGRKFGKLRRAQRRIWKLPLVPTAESGCGFI